MPITDLQRSNIRRFITGAKERLGSSDDEIYQELLRRGAPPQEVRSALMELAGALPTSEVPAVEDRGLVSGAVGLTGAALKDSVVGPFAGILERAGMVEPGTKEGIRRNFEEERVNFLAGDPGPLRASIAGIAEAGSMAVPIAPGGPVGRAAARGLGLTGRAARAAAGGIAGGLEGAVVAAGDSILVDEGERAKVGLVQTLGAAALGTSAGLRTTSHVVSDADTQNFQKRFFRNEKRKSPEVTIAERAASLHNQWINSLSALEKVGKRSGLESQFSESAQRIRVAQSISRSPIYSFTRDLSGGRTGEGLSTILKDAADAADHLGVNDEEFFQDFQHYLVSQRQIELSGRPKIKTDKAATKAARKRLGDLASKYGVSQGSVRNLSTLAARFRDWTVRAHLDPLVEVGVLSGDEYAKILDDNQLFAPFQRAMDELADRGIDLSMGGTPLKGKMITEGISPEAGRRLEDVFGVAADRAMRISVFAEQQRMRNLLADAASANREIAAEIKPVTELLKVRLSPEDAKKLGMTDQQIQKRFVDDVVDGKKEPAVFRQLPKKGPKTFSVWKDGQRQSYTAPEDVLKALETMNPGEFGAFTRFFSSPLGKATRTATGLFRAGTTMAVEFGVRNVSRDPFTLGVYSKHGAIPFLSSVRAFADALFDIRGGREIWQDFVDSPAAHATFLSPDRWNLARELRLAQEVAKKSPLRRALSATVANPLLPLQKLSDGMEKFSRFAEFSRARRTGKSINQAGVDAADVTLNFPRAGSVGKSINMAEAFFNAQIQDVDKFIRAAKDRPFATALKGFAYLTVPMLYSYSKFRDDPDYQNLPEWQKVLTLPMYKLENGRFISLPKPPGVLNVVFSYLPQKAIEYLDAKAAGAGDFATREKIRESLSAFVEQTPLAYAPVVGDVGGEPGDWVITALPNVLQPMVELKANRMPFFDRPVAGRSIQDLPAALRRTEYSSSPALAVGGGPLAETVGGPVGVDHLIRGYLGTLGRVGAEALSPDRDETLMRRNLPSWARDLPVIRNFVRGLTSSSPVGFGSKPVERFYDLATQVAQHERGVRVQESGKAQEEYRRRHPESRHGKTIRKYKEEIGRLGELRQMVVDSKSLTPTQKDDRLLQIDSQITMLAADGFELVEAMVEQELKSRANKGEI